MHTLQNNNWQIEFTPEKGGSVTIGRIRRAGTWIDIMIPSKMGDAGFFGEYANFILAPWSNRIRDAKFQFQGKMYPLRVNMNDGTAIHGDTYDRPWQVVEATEKQLTLRFDSQEFDDMNYPFAFSAVADYRLEGSTFIMSITLTNEDTKSIPAGFGHHPYFARWPGGKDNTAQLTIPCEKSYRLTQALPEEAASPIEAKLDFREPRSLDTTPFLDDLLTGRLNDDPIRIHYPAWGMALEITSDSIFEHVVVYAPEEKDFFAVEPVTNCNDGFNLYEQGVEGTGVFTLEPGESKTGTIRIKLSC